LPLFYFGDVDNGECKQFQSLIPPIQCDYHKNDFNNNRLLTSEALLTVNSKDSIQNSDENKYIIDNYRQLYHKLRFLGKKILFNYLNHFH